MTTGGLSFGASLQQSYKDAAVKERHFTTPLALHAKRPPPPQHPDWPAKKKKTGGKGDKTKAKTKIRGASNTPEGKPICFRYNSKQGCKKGAKCHFAHVCTVCFQKHPVLQCKQKAAAKDAAGAGATN